MQHLTLKPTYHNPILEYIVQLGRIPTALVLQLIRPLVPLENTVAITKLFEGVEYIGADYLEQVEDLSGFG